MIQASSLRLRLSLVPLVAIAAISIWLAPARTDPPTSAKPNGNGEVRQKEIADLEKQINENSKQLAEDSKKLAERQKQLADLTGKLQELKNLPTEPISSDGTIPETWIKALHWRCIGPANMSGRITAISVYEADPSTWWVASASGGLAKTTNNGISFEHQFDHEATVSIGSVCVAPSDKNIVWVGTGENNPRNSVSYGDGVYKSTDGGKTWKNMGLKKSFQIGKIIVHPKDPNVVYVGALGRLYGPNEERGLFRTTDGGKTWEKALYIDDKTGVIDMRMSPDYPDTLIVATWEHKRDGFDAFFGENTPVPDMYGPIVTHGAGTGLHKTTDGGKTWKKLASGLPTVKMGRIGLDWSHQNPEVVFAVIDTEKAGTGDPPSAVFMGVAGENVTDGAKLVAITKDGPAEKAGLKEGDIITTMNQQAVKTYDGLVEEIRKHKPGDKLALTVLRGKEKLEITVTLANRPETGGPGGGPGGGRAGGPGGARISAGFFGEDVKEGIQVNRVQENSSAAKAGIKADDVVTTFEGKPVPAMRDLFMKLSQDYKAGDKVKFGVLRGKEKLEVTIELEARAGGPGGQGGPTPGKPYATQLGGQRENVQDQQGKDGWQTGGVYKSTDAGETWKRINSLNPRPMYFSLIRVDPSNDSNLYVGGVGFYYSTDGGKKFQQGKDRGVHSDHHALWIDPKDGRHMIIGTDGGFYQTYDQAERWDHLNHVDFGQFYHVVIDPRPNYKVYGGLQDNGSWGGPAQSPKGGIVNDDWFMLFGGDGFVCGVDPSDPDQVYYEMQNGGMGRRNLRTGEQQSIGPRRGASQARMRFNWNTPFILSKHNPSIYYCAAQYVFRSVKKGDELKTVSPEITLTPKGSGTALAESPKNPDVLWAGTDDGGLWVTRDGGANWKNVLDSVKKAGLPGPRWVATIDASAEVEGRAYVAFDAHRSDDDNPYLFVTEDFGATWKSITSNLPWGSTRVCREDIFHPNVLYVGTEFGAWVSANRGKTWTKMNSNLPTVAVHEFAQHPVTGELVAATHGRSIWICDVSALRQINNDSLKAKATLFAPVNAIRWRRGLDRSMFNGAERKFVGENPDRGATIYYSLARKPEKIELKVLDYAGQLVRKLDASADPGLHKVVWDLGRMPNMRPQAAPPAPSGESAPAQAPARGAGGGRGSFGFAPPAPIGVYRVVLVVDGQEFTQPLRVESDPTTPPNYISEEIDLKELEKMWEEEEEEEETPGKPIDD
jgi:photosystem II stability/assembly factor-like uncharacterized protein/uncharacterized coiled-coil protein SlyX